MTEIIRVVFIGERFYKESQTLMSAIYKIPPDGKFVRYDWGFLQLDISAGKEIYIRPATEKEIKFFEGKLNETDHKEVCGMEYANRSEMFKDKPCTKPKCKYRSHPLPVTNPMKRIYLAGSWKNQQEILLIRDILKSHGHEVDCFASEENGRISFNWSKLADIQDKLPNMDAKDMLEVPRVQKAFKEDKKWIDWCNICILTLPSGKSSHLEAGYAKGQGKIVIIFGDLQKGDFDVMYGFADAIFRCDEIDQMIDFVNSSRPLPTAPRTWETCGKHFTCPDGEECWYGSEDYYWDCGRGMSKLIDTEKKAAAQARADVLKLFIEIEDGIAAYENEHKHQQAKDECCGIYIPVNVVRRLIKVRKESLRSPHQPHEQPADHQCPHWENKTCICPPGERP